MASLAVLGAIRKFVLFITELAAMSFVLCPQASAATPILVQAGPPHVLFQWNTAVCSKNFIPDAPARMLRLANGSILFLATSNENWVMVGPDFSKLKQQCTPVFPPNIYDTDLNGNLWIEALYSFNGKTIFGIASQDLSALEEKKGCDRGKSRSKCWVNALIGVRSNNMGDSFQLQNQGDAIATMGTAYQHDWTTREGFFTISNIIKVNKFYYAFVSMANIISKTSGNCLIRTDQPSDPSSWRGWNGKAFTAPLRTNAKLSSNSCAIIGAGMFDTEIRSLNFIPRKSIYVAVFTARRKLPEDTHAIPGTYYSTSRDLLKWSIPQRLFIAPTLPRVDSKLGIYNYPVLLDPSSKSRNFETIDSSNPVLVYIYEHLQKNGSGSMDRDIMYVPIRLN